MKTLILFLALAVTASAQSIILKDGKVVATKGLRRQGDNIIATVEIPGQDKPSEMAYPLSQITKLDFPEPVQLRTVPEFIAQGRGADALAQLEPILKYYEGFRDAPGSWWAPLALRKVQALGSLGRDKEVEQLAAMLDQPSTDPAIKMAANVQIAVGLARKGEFAHAQALVEPALASSKEPETLAPAYLVKGQCLLEKKEWEDAVLAFAEIPVFYPNEKSLMPQALLGRGRAHFGLDDLPAARAALDELTKNYPNSPEAKAATPEIDKVTRREKALAPP